MTIFQCTAHNTSTASSEFPENQEPPPSGLSRLNISNIHLSKTLSNNIQKAESFFCLKRWSQDTLEINEQGHLSLEINGIHLDLYNLAKSLSQKKQWPVLLRFPALITKNISALQQAFFKAIGHTGYQNGYTLAYPLKVNPHAGVIKAMMESEQAEHITFEVGSKAELIIALTKTTHHQRIMCNGFKDESYLSLVLEAAKAGQKVCLVFETLDEVHLLIKKMKKSLESLPEDFYLGLRLRLSTPVEGHWEDSNGQHSKFGLSSLEALEVIQTLKKHHGLSHLKVMHIHPGSQILALRELSSCFQECVRYYHELLKLGAPIQYVDIGGGLAMDYSGAAEEKLRDYTLDDYAMAIVEPMEKYCRENHLPQPHLISETGRNTVALSSMLLTNIQPLGASEEAPITPITKPDKNTSVFIQQLWELHLFISNFQNDEHTESAQKQQHFLLENIRKEFIKNELSLTDLAWAEKVYAHNQVLFQGSEHYQKYIANFSVFQSMPDYWGIQQFFPMLSLHGYEHELSRSGVFYDLTCDSDGVVKHYLHPEKLQSKLSMPDSPVEFMGIFLMGAYQEIMASGHNLFEKLPCLDIIWNAEKKAFMTEVYEACDIGDSLMTIGYHREELMKLSENKFTSSMHDLLKNNLEKTSYLEFSSH